MKLTESAPVKVLVLLVVHDDPPEAHVAIRGTNGSLVVPAQPIASDAGIPVNELPGREFTATMTITEDATTLAGFTLLNDPRI